MRYNQCSPFFHQLTRKVDTGRWGFLLTFWSLHSTQNPDAASVSSTSWSPSSVSITDTLSDKISLSLCFLSVWICIVNKKIDTRERREDEKGRKEILLMKIWRRLKYAQIAHRKRQCSNESTNPPRCHVQSTDSSLWYHREKEHMYIVDDHQHIGGMYWPNVLAIQQSHLGE